MHFFYIAMLFLLGVTAASAQSVEGQFAYPPVGTELETSEGIFRVVSVKGYDAVFLDKQSGRTHGVHANVMFGPTVGLDLKYRKSIPERLWPLEVGKRVQFDTDRDRVVRGVRIEVVRTETITVPAGTFFTYVVETNERGVSGPVPGPAVTTTRWYAPEIGTIIRLRQRGVTQGSTSGWELLRITRPDGAPMVVAPNLPTSPALSARPPSPPVPPAASPASPQATTSPNTQDPATRLQVLKGLLDRGLITRDEYNSRREKILDSL